MKKSMLLIITIIVSFFLVNVDWTKTYDNRRVKRAVSVIYKIDSTFASTDTLVIGPLQWDDEGYRSLFIMTNADSTKIYYQLCPYSAESTTVWAKVKLHLFQTTTDDSGDVYQMNIPTSKYVKFTVYMYKSTSYRLRLLLHLWED